MDLRVTHDYEAEAFYMLHLSGLRINKDSKLKHALTKMYFCFAMSFMMFVGSLSATCGFMVTEKIKALEGIHWTLLLVIVGSFVPIKLSMLKKEHLELIRTGFFTYEGEPPDDRHYKRKEFHVWRSRILSKVFLVLVASAAIFMSFARVFSNSSDSDDEHINPIFPFPVYTPFNTYTTVGFIFGYLIQEVAIFYLYVITGGTIELFLSIMEQWIAQFEILNMSISNVQERAVAIYNSKTKLNDRESVDKLRYSKEFQRCVSKCLRQNVMHHHILLRFRDSVARYIQIMFMVLVIGPVVVLSAMSIIILEIEHISEVFILLWLLVTEIGYLFALCYYGDLLKTESEKVFFSLWDTPWWNFDKSNRLTLLIMMANVRKPTVMSAPGLNSDLSTESFGDIMARAYQFMSVIRNFK